MKVYAGIGSRRTPTAVLATMTAIARRLNARGYMLSSGGAPGADTAFELGAGTNKRIFLPWKGFNANPSQRYEIDAPAFEMAAKFHPAWERCSIAARKFHARNCYQVLGYDLDDPVEFVVCWTPGGSGSGGTGQALRIAKAHNIPIFDLGLGSQVLNDLARILK